MIRRFSFSPSNPFHFWSYLHPNPTHGFILGSGARTPVDHRLFLSAGEPARVFSARHATDSRLFEEIKRSLRRGSASAIPRWVGTIHFDMGRAFDTALARLPERRAFSKAPPALFGDYPSVVEIDTLKGITTLHCRDAAAFKKAEKKITDYFRIFFTPPNLPTDTAWGGIPPHVSSMGRLGGEFHWPSFKKFAAMVREAKAHISRGDIYQANLSLRFDGTLAMDPIAYYERLCRANPSPYACLIKSHDSWIASASPELLFRVDSDRVVTRPIAGTRPRGENQRDDAKKQGQLLLSPKERAEHIMLVDLERNDLGRVCRPGSVRVIERFAVERYSHVMHIVSQVEGRLRSGMGSMDALRALFPGGTITGCPKIKAIEIIEALENQSRGPFYGGAGAVMANGDAVFNILIRTAFIHNRKISIRAGAGIVADSHAAREYQEIGAKASALLKAAGYDLQKSHLFKR